MPVRFKDFTLLNWTMTIASGVVTAAIIYLGASINSRIGQSKTNRELIRDLNSYTHNSTYELKVTMSDVVNTLEKQQAILETVFVISASLKHVQQQIDDLPEGLEKHIDRLESQVRDNHQGLQQLRREVDRLRYGSPFSHAPPKEMKETP